MTHHSPAPAHRFVVAASWWVASELVRRTPDLKLIETHPGGGQYDCLSLVSRSDGTWTTLIDLNRAGRMHVHHTADGRPFEPLTWAAPIADADAHAAVKQLEAAAGLTPAQPAPPTGVATVTYWVIAQLLASVVNDRRKWDVRNEQHDSSGSEGGPNHYLAGLPQLRSLVLDRRDDDVMGVPEYRYWALLRDGEVCAVFDGDGAVHLLTGETHDLLQLYRDRGRSLTAVLGAALGDVLP